MFADEFAWFNSEGEVNGTGEEVAGEKFFRGQELRGRKQGRRGGDQLSWWQEGGGTFVRPQYSGQRSAKFLELIFLSLKWAAQEECALLLPPATHQPWVCTWGQRVINHEVKGQRGNRTHDLHLDHLWACQFSPTSHLLIYGPGHIHSLLPSH